MDVRNPIGGAMGLVVNDPSHRAWNDVWQALADTGLWAFVLLFQVVLDLNFGPWDGSSFFSKAEDALTKRLRSRGVARLSNNCFIH